MQMSIYYKEEDRYLLSQVARLAERNRRSKSATILAILEDYFESDRLLGQILKEMGIIDNEELNKAIAEQTNGNGDRNLGEIMLEKGFINESQLERALQLQSRSGNKRELNSSPGKLN